MYFDLESKINSVQAVMTPISHLFTKLVEEQAVCANIYF